jgi:hypothetical protein
MGSLTSMINDLYDDYVYFCKTLNVESVGMHDNKISFLIHEYQLLEKIGFKTKEDFYEVLRKAENRDKKIKEILDDKMHM